MATIYYGSNPFLSHTLILPFQAPKPYFDTRTRMNNVGMDDTFYILGVHPLLSNDYFSGQYLLRISFLRIFPWGLLGRDSRNSTDLGAL